MSMFQAALAVTYVLVSGYGLFRTIARSNTLFSIFGLVPLSFVMGFGFLAFWSNFVMLARLHLSFWLLVVPLLPFFAFGLFGIKWNFDRQRALNKLKAVRWTEWLLIAVVVGGVSLSVLLCLVLPMGHWDSRAIWALKGKMLFADGTVFTQDFLDPYRVHPHFRYPLLFPIAQAFIYFAIGAVDDWVVMLLVALFFPLAVAFLFELLRLATHGPNKALLGAALLSVMPVFFLSDGPAHSGYADTCLTLFFLVGFGLIYLWRQTKDGELLWLGCLVAACLPLVKNEGMLLWLLIALWTAWPERLVLNWAVCLRVGRSLSVLLLVTALIVGPWLSLRSYIPNANDEDYFGRLHLGLIASNIGRVPIIAKFFVRSLLGFQEALTGMRFLWGGLWLVVVLALVRAVRRGDRQAQAIFFTLLLHCVLLVPIFVISPATGEDFGMISNFFRLCMPITPLAIVLAVSQTARPACVSSCNDETEGLNEFGELSQNDETHAR